ncbi:hypothetical protein JWJ90_02395 [Desulfobulbus rhabdoformis]|uniref:hypothetical protein n=1 Tax=Desulfobulbus rhabdoformis TaxID=34032 RepID=UPI001964BAD1|nr:hypothetical protein [Desulfobulbus rhabdoformis]MBM9613131.1 hypothetical protein [Desulfobulbus rhabdoformis]
MFRLATLSRPCDHMSAEELTLKMSPLLSQGLDLLCCQSVGQSASLQDKKQENEATLLAQHMGLTYSCFASDRRRKDTEKNSPLFGQVVFSGPGVWVLNSGSFLIGEGKNEEAVLFALVRKNGSSVLVFNFHLADTAKKQEQQLTQIFQQNILKEPYGAVAICTDQPSLLSQKKWFNITSHSTYQPYQCETCDQGMIGLFKSEQGSITQYPQDMDPKNIPGLSLLVDVKRTVRSRRSRPSFPLSFREQWLGYRDNRVFA